MNKTAQFAIDNVEESYPKEFIFNYGSPEWLELMEEAEKAQNASYTIIYRDSDGSLKEAWHFLSELNLTYIKNKYKRKNQEILYFEPKTLDFGQRLAQISGNSKVAR